MSETRPQPRARDPRLTFAQRIGLMAGVAILIPLLFAALIYGNHRSDLKKTAAAAREQRGLALSNELELLVVNMETGSRGFLITEQEEFLEPYRMAVTRYPGILDELERTVSTARDQAILAEIRLRIGHWRSQLAEPRIAFLRLHPRSPGTETVQPVLPIALEPLVGKAAMDAIRGRFDALKSSQEERISRTLKGMTASQAALSRLLWSAAVAFSVLSLFGTWRLAALYRTRTGPLFAGIAAAERGDYRAVPLAGSDEPARIAAAFNRMVGQVQRRDEDLRQALENQQRLTEERGRALAALKASNKELEEFSYSISHDLRAPLRHVTGYAEMLRRHATGSLDEKSRRFLATISESARQMGRLVDDLLEFSRIGRAGVTRGTVRLTEMVLDVRRELEASGLAMGVVWSLEGLPEVQADPSMLRMALVHLISNAVKYSGTRAEPRVEIGSFPEGGETVVFVRDNGVGFDMRYVHKLFGVFQRLHRDEEFEGTGIGLANVRRIIDRHGGRTWAEGSVGAGATFFFSLPGLEAAA